MGKLRHRVITGLEPKCQMWRITFIGSPRQTVLMPCSLERPFCDTPDALGCVLLLKPA